MAEFWAYKNSLMAVLFLWLAGDFVGSGSPAAFFLAFLSYQNCVEVVNFFFNFLD